MENSKGQATCALLRVSQVMVQLDNLLGVHSQQQERPRQPATLEAVQADAKAGEAKESGTEESTAATAAEPQEVDPEHLSIREVQLLKDTQASMRQLQGLIGLAPRGKSATALNLELYRILATHWCGPNDLRSCLAQISALFLSLTKDLEVLLSAEREVRLCM